ncbi:MAG: hypothetical protein A2653_02900 [Candidatus Zambryskibacteria bacterium RIFCSPHIGHO2_01_FULL_43_25]|uniref:TrbC/VIRB2 family protein n=1 Tax=Candidatus Zambryskibacteria bacterium RIFCSPLOWO2_01_FULL_45_21 TaxID=1802761 RepID=A0A1G2U091_9BACT|nr:MAG: hypothetical protein A2653_02900 [Candidatus Zambryskibacteria bacterium RIFCSPHIGHO2_01_FULL_43_25]OHB00928.1 MAG: hypothetical protein A3E94_00100 [Candidatus Zambryskibacteria bacterium RIFCSPHIGHO2_12_FULL_44_12b]OHB02956.1 MAG: hypothetical protein A3B14_00745 [Candidatus Zambryskibacteria bacterium RIFCSPLOWO2_01_FULL_45_21]
MRSFFRTLSFAVAQITVLGIFTLPLIVSASIGNPGGLQNPLKGGTDNLYDFIRVVINDVILPVGGVVVTIMIIFAGFKFVTAQGNEAKLEVAKRNFLYVAIGTAVLLGAWVIAKAIEATINQLTTTP